MKKHQAMIIDESIAVTATGIAFTVVCCAGSTNEKQFSGHIEKMHKLTPQERVRRLRDIVDEVADDHAAEHAASESMSSLLTNANLLVKKADCCSGGATPAAIALDDTPVAEAMPVDVVPTPAPVVVADPVPPAQDPAAVVEPPPEVPQG